GQARAHLNDPEIDGILGRIQNDLFTLGADLASPADVKVPRIDQPFVEALEAVSDELLPQLEPLKEFILPGGSAAGSALHVARAVARRAERRVVALARDETVNPETIVYLNRLSDLLFIIARIVN